MSPSAVTTMATTTTAIHPRIGVGVFILQSPPKTASNPTFIMGTRIGSFGAGTLGLPGGHLEFGESFEECAAREVLEETGLEVRNIQYLTATNDLMHDEGRHYVTIFMVCERVDADKAPELLEPHKCQGWQWVEWRDMVEWARLQGEERRTEKVTNGDSVVDVAAAAPSPRRVKREGSRPELFSPMIALTEQRPGVVPSLG